MLKERRLHCVFTVNRKTVFPAEKIPSENVSSAYLAAQLLMIENFLAT